MPTSRAVIGIVLALATLTACSSDDDGVEVELLAGGGEQSDGTGADASVPGPLQRLTSGSDGTLWGVTGSHVLVEIDAEGVVRSTQLQLDSGAVQEIAAAPDGTVYVLPDRAGQEGAEAVVLQLADGELQPAVGVPAGEPDRPGPVTPDGEPAAEARLGPVGDIAVDAEGRLLLTEQVDPAGADAGFLLRRVESDGTLSTVAGRPNPDHDRELTDDESAAAFFPDGAAATDLVLFAESAIAAGPGEQVAVQTTRSVYVVDGGSATTVLGAAGGGPLPAATAGPFAGSAGALTLDYQAGFPQLTLAVNPDGAILASAASIGGIDHDAFAWRVEDGGDRAQAVADAAAGDAQTANPTLYVTPGGDAAVATVFGGPATWLDDDTIAVAASGDGDQIVVTLDVED